MDTVYQTPMTRGKLRVIYKRYIIKKVRYPPTASLDPSFPYLPLVLRYYIRESSSCDYLRRQCRKVVHARKSKVSTPTTRFERKMVCIRYHVEDYVIVHLSIKDRTRLGFEESPYPYSICMSGVDNTIIRRNEDRDCYVSDPTCLSYCQNQELSKNAKEKVLHVMSAEYLISSLGF